MYVYDVFYGVVIWEVDVVEKVLVQESIGQFFFVVIGDYNNWVLFGFYKLLGFVDEEFYMIQFQQQVVGEFDICFVDFINQQYYLFVGFKCFLEFIFDDVVLDVFDFFVI